MNEIQRFKKNRMIPKGLYGLDSHTIMGAKVNGNHVAYVNIPGKGYVAVDSQGNVYTYDENSGKGLKKDSFRRINPTKYDLYHIRNAAMNGKMSSMYGSRGFTFGNIIKYWKNLNNQQGSSVKKTTENFSPLYGSTLTSEEIAAHNTTVAADKTKGTGKSAIRSKIAPKGQAYWDSQYQDFLGKMTDDLKAWLKDRGIDYSSAEKMQKYLNNVGKSVGKFGADGKWGNDSLAAWDDLVATTMKDNPLQAPIKEEVKPEPVVDAPDPFGYKTSNTYEGDDFMNKVQGMGIRSNADLINFMYKSGEEGWKGDAWQTQFRSDVDRALGGDYTDTNIRKVFGTQGRWGKGFMGRGDFGDFQNALQTNAGVWNGMYDRKQEEARMEVGRQQAGAKMIKQYMELNPILLTASKFTINNGMGAKTLGYPGAGSLNTTDNYDWLEVPKLYNYQLKLDLLLNNLLPNDLYSPSEDLYNLLGNWEKIQATQTGYSL